MKDLDAYQDAILKLTTGNCKDSAKMEVALKKLEELNINVSVCVVTMFHCQVHTEKCIEAV